MLDEEQVVEELLAYFPEAGAEFFREGFEKRKFEHRQLQEWLPAPSGPPFLTRFVRWILMWPCRVWKWAYRNYPSEGSIFQRLPWRALIALTKPMAVWLGSCRKFPTDESLVELYRRMDAMATIALGMGFSYERERARAVLGVLQSEIIAKPGMKVLDFGCGVAAFSLLLAQGGCKVTLLDVKSEVSAFAQRRFERYQLPYTFIPHDANLLDSSYDTIMCLDVLEHLRRPVDTLISLHGALVPGGVLLLSGPSEWGHGYGHLREAAENWEVRGGEKYLATCFELVDSHSTYFRAYRKRAEMRNES